MTRINLDTTANIWRCALPRGCNKLVLQAFAHHINSDETHPHHGLAWPSVQRIALMCGMSPRTVQVHVRALQTAGLLRPRLRTGRTTLYQVNTAALVPLVFPRDTVELDVDGNPVDNSAVPFPGAADSAENQQDFDTESAENDTEHTEICTLKLELKLESKQEDSPAAVAPASPVPPYPLFEEVKPKTLADFAACRKDKFGRGAKGKVTEELISQIAEQAALVGLTLQAALEYCCHPERRWANFKAEWLKPKTSSASAPAAPIKVWTPEREWTAEEMERSRVGKEAAMAAYKAKLAAETATDQPSAAGPVAALPRPALVPKPGPAAAPTMPTGLHDIRLPPDAPQLARDLVAQLKAGQKLTMFKRDYLAGYLKIPAKTLMRASPLSH